LPAAQGLVIKAQENVLLQSTIVHLSQRLHWRGLINGPRGGEKTSKPQRGMEEELEKHRQREGNLQELRGSKDMYRKPNITCN